MNKLDYILAEESFLENFCVIEDYPWGKSYFWEQGKRWPKFNFLRILKKPDTEEFKYIIKNNTVNDIISNIKIDIQYSIDDLFNDVPFKFKFGGVPISFVHSKEFEVLSSTRTTINKVHNITELLSWWLINSSGRSRDNAERSPLYKVLLKNFDKHHFYILKIKDTNKGIGCFALTDIDEFNCNLWGIAIAADYQKKGYLSEIYSWVTSSTKKGIFGQINIDSPTFISRNKNNTTRVGLIEKKYEVLS